MITAGKDVRTLEVVVLGGIWIEYAHKSLETEETRELGSALWGIQPRYEPDRRTRALYNGKAIARHRVKWGN